MHSKEQLKSLLEAVTHYSKNLDERALAYLEGRGISEDVAQQFSLGVVTDPINGHETHAGWLSVPYLTALGMCVGVKFRRLDDGKPKYGAPTGQKGHSPVVVVCEGELDAVVVSGILNLPAVGVPGVQAWKPHFNKLFTGYDTVYVVGDNDIKEDGTNPGAEFSRRVSQEVMNSRIVSLPPSMDINDFYLTHGKDEALKLFGGV
jgi:DNA primase